MSVSVSTRSMRSMQSNSHSYTTSMASAVERRDERSRPIAYCSQCRTKVDVWQTSLTELCRLTRGVEK